MCIDAAQVPVCIGMSKFAPNPLDFLGSSCSSCGEASRAQRTEQGALQMMSSCAMPVPLPAVCADGSNVAFRFRIRPVQSDRTYQWSDVFYAGERDVPYLRRCCEWQ